jgi:hypothetical protein
MRDWRNAVGFSSSYEARHSLEREVPPRRARQTGDATTREEHAAGLLGQLQSRAGNRAVDWLVRQAQAQREGEVSTVETGILPAGRSQQGEGRSPAGTPGIGAIQRQAAEEEEEPQVQAKSAAASLAQRSQSEEDDPQLQAKLVSSLQRAAPEEEDEVQAQAKAAGPGGGTLHTGLAERIQARRGAGEGLDVPVRARMEDAFGAGFAAVRIHNDSESHSLNRSINALAFTTGNDIFFRQGLYHPDSRAGRELLAHELTHVVQQRESAGSGRLTVGPVGDSMEQEADAVGASVARSLEATDGGISTGS